MREEGEESVGGSHPYYTTLYERDTHTEKGKGKLIFPASAPAATIPPFFRREIWGEIRQSQ